MLAKGAWEIMDSDTPSISAQVNSQYKKELIHNRSIYVEVIRNLRWLVTQGLAIREKLMNRQIFTAYLKCRLQITNHLNLG